MRRAAVVSLSVLALVGCSAAGEREPPGTVPSLSPAATPTASVPPLPAAAQGDGPEAASEFAKYYLGLVTLALQRADPALLEPHSQDGCEGCNSLMATVQRIAAERQRAEGGEFSFQQVVAAESSPGDFLVLIDYTRSETRYVDRTGATVSTEPAVPLTSSQMRVVRVGSVWQVYGYRTMSA